MKSLARFIGVIIYAVLYLSPIIGNMIWIIDSRKKRGKDNAVAIGDVFTMLFRYLAFGALIYFILK